MIVGNRRSEMKRKMVEYNSHESPYRPNSNLVEWERLVEKKEEEYSPYLANTLSILRETIKNFKEDNEKVIETQEILTRAQQK